GRGRHTSSKRDWSPDVCSSDRVARLRAAGLRTVMLPGDGSVAAGRIAEQVAVDEVHSGLMPGEKVDFVRDLQSQGRRVAMVGDGVNDARALAAADLGMAVATGSDVAISAADLVLVRSRLTIVPDSVDLAAATLRTIRVNLLWAFGYNVAAIPIAASGLLNPVISAAAMAFSSFFVVSNSLRLRRFAPPTPRAGALRREHQDRNSRSSSSNLS